VLLTATELNASNKCCCTPSIVEVPQFVQDGLFVFPARERDAPWSCRNQSWRPTQHPIQCLPGGLFLLELSGRRLKLFTYSYCGGQKWRSCTSVPSYSSVTWFLITYKDNVIFVKDLRFSQLDLITEATAGWWWVWSSQWNVYRGKLKYSN
jgi:hypothetical protein